VVKIKCEYVRRSWSTLPNKLNNICNKKIRKKVKILHLKNNDFEGVKNVIKLGQCKNKFLELDLIKLNENSSIELKTKDFEEVLVVQQGTCEVKTEDKNKKLLGKRSDVFNGKAEALYLPDGNTIKLYAKTDFKAVLCRARSNRKGNIVFLPSEKIFVESRGAYNWKREIHTIVGKDFPSQRIHVGETYNISGSWSGIPPHRHCNNNFPLETYTEEIYLFRTDPSKGFGILRIYDESEQYDELFTVKDEDIVFFEKGFHPVVGVAGCRIYYLWLMAGELKEIRSIDDPNFNWMQNAEKIFDEISTERIKYK